MKLSFCTLGCPNWTIPQIVENAAKMGYHGVELRGVSKEHIGPDETPQARAEVKKRFADAGVEIACIMGYSRFAVADAAEKQKQVEAATKMLDLAKDIGCGRVRFFGGVKGDLSLDDAVAHAAEGLKKVAAHAQKLGVNIALETHDDWCVGADVVRLVRAVDSPAMGVCWDYSNSFFAEPTRETYAAVKPYVKHVHTKDAYRDAAGKIHSCLPGKGQVDSRLALGLLKDAGYDGWVSFEWEKKWEPSLEEPEVALPVNMKLIVGLMKELGIKIG
jgi:sugar phosphate isomerase/epimerase